MVNMVNFTPLHENGTIFSKSSFVIVMYVHNSIFDSLSCHVTVYSRDQTLKSLYLKNHNRYHFENRRNDSLY